MSSVAPGPLQRSSYLSTFAHMGDVFLYHDLYGYILKMSPDVLAFIDEFASAAQPADICERYRGKFDGQEPESFLDVFDQFSCLVEAGTDEVDGIWHMVPVRGKWNVWYREDDKLTFYTGWGERPVAKHELTALETKFWDACDGETTLSRMRSDFDGAALGDFIQRMVHHDIQALKLSPLPWSMFKGRRDMEPPYLTSTMPYAEYRSGDPVDRPGDGDVSTIDYYTSKVDDAQVQFDHHETTLSHLLRNPHPAIGDRTYGQAMIQAIMAKSPLPDKCRILEIGAGLGFLTQAVCQELADRDLTYEILELSPALAAAQRERCAGLPVTIREANCLTVDLESGLYDLIIANEMIGDLPALQLAKDDILEGGGDDIAERGRALVSEYQLNVIDAPDPFYLNSGAMELIARVARWLAPGGAAIMTEFGEMARYPRLSSHLDHPELSIHFGHLCQAAKILGLEASVDFVIDLFDFDRSLEGLATTRSYFKALKFLLAERDVDLEKIGYTREMFSELLSDKVDIEKVGQLHFDRIEDRLMGLVPHEFKALILRQPIS